MVLVDIVEQQAARCKDRCGDDAPATDRAMKDNDIFLSVPTRLAENPQAMKGDEETEEIDDRYAHAESSEPDIETPFKRGEVVQSPLPPLFQRGSEKEFSRRRSPGAQEESLDGNPYEKFKGDQMFKLPQRIMAGQKGPNGPKEEKKKGIIEEAGKKTDPRVDAGGILLWQSLMVDDDFRWLNDPIVHNTSP